MTDVTHSVLYFKMKLITIISSFSFVTTLVHEFPGIGLIILLVVIRLIMIHVIFFCSHHEFVDFKTAENF